MEPVNPAGAAEFLEAEQALLIRNAGKVLRNWGWSDPTAALAWLNQHPAADEDTFSAFGELITVGSKMILRERLHTF